MATYIILSKLGPHAFETPDGLKGIATLVREKLRKECPKAKWVQSYGCMGSYDAPRVWHAPRASILPKQMIHNRLRKQS